MNIDTKNPNLSQNTYIYQYEPYLHNLQFRKIYQLVILLIFFISFMLMIKKFVDQLNPAIVGWDAELFELLLWNIPKKYEGRLTVDKAMKEAYLNIDFTYE